ncbi:lipoprotein [Rahnella woolbedingensis]|uniref:Lipoprotein n=1 Tax=Rahnella woolbedingensis TaxID=1510574 RepID=A0A419NDX8_9GAMM|nr:lipoprotein [Rahnella woolbedingensis]RJT46833.1 lipoprotein [Rahnella woolbedingensis]
MKKKTLVAAIPLVFMLNACTTVEPAYKDIGSRTAPCVDGGPDSVAQQFYDFRIKQGGSGLPNSSQLAAYRPYLSTALYNALLKAQTQPKVDIAATPNEKSGTGAGDGDLFSSQFDAPTSASVDSASTIPNTDARNIPLRVTFTHEKDKSASTSWKDEVLMVREGKCWTVDDVRYMANLDFASSGTLRQVLENQ